VGAIGASRRRPCSGQTEGRADGGTDRQWEGQTDRMRVEGRDGDSVQRDRRRGRDVKGKKRKR
jgi:hypothetical protein